MFILIYATFFENTVSFGELTLV